MKDLILLKIICHVSFYLSIISFLVFIAEGENLVLTFPIFIGAIFLRVWLRPRGSVSYLPLLLLITCFLIVPFDLLHIVPLMPLFIYAYFAPDYITEKSSRYDYGDNFKRARITFFVLITFAILYGLALLWMNSLFEGGSFRVTRHSNPITVFLYSYLSTHPLLGEPSLLVWVDLAIRIFIQTAFPMAMIYIFSAVLLLRMQQYEIENRMPHSLKLMNIFSIASTMITASVISVAVAIGASFIRIPNFNLNPVDRGECAFVQEDHDEEVIGICRQQPPPPPELGLLWPPPGRGVDWDWVDCWCRDDSRLDEESEDFIGEWFVYEYEETRYACGVYHTFINQTYLYVLSDAGYERYITDRGDLVVVEGFSPRSFWCYVPDDEWAGTPRELNPFILAGIIGIILFLIIRFLLKNRPQFTKSEYLEEDAVVEIRDSLDLVLNSKRNKRRLNENQIRAIYQKFLILLQKAEVRIAPQMTSLDIEDLVKNKSDLQVDVLRDIYIKIRYAEHEYSKDDIKQMKQIYKALKKEIKQLKDE